MGCDEDLVILLIAVIAVRCHHGSTHHGAWEELIIGVVALRVDPWRGVVKGYNHIITILYMHTHIIYI